MASRSPLKHPEVMLFIARYNDDAETPLAWPSIVKATAVPSTTLRRQIDTAKLRLAEEKEGVPGDSNEGDQDKNTQAESAAKKTANGKSSVKVKNGTKRKATEQPAIDETHDTPSSKGTQQPSESSKKKASTKKRQRTGGHGKEESVIKAEPESEDNGNPLKNAKKPVSKVSAKKSKAAPKQEILNGHDADQDGSTPTTEVPKQRGEVAETATVEFGEEHQNGSTTSEQNADGTSSADAADIADNGPATGTSSDEHEQEGKQEGGEGEGDGAQNDDGDKEHEDRSEAEDMEAV